MTFKENFYLTQIIYPSRLLWTLAVLSFFDIYIDTGHFLWRVGIMHRELYSLFFSLKGQSIKSNVDERPSVDLLIFDRLMKQKQVYLFHSSVNKYFSLFLFVTNQVSPSNSFQILLFFPLAQTLFHH